MELECFKLVPSGNLKLVEAVSETLGSKNKAKKLINEGLVAVNGIKELRYRRTVSPKDRIVVSLNPCLFERKPLRLLYLKKGVAVISKPPFLNTNLNPPDLEGYLRKRLGKEWRVVHRLDRQTSGAVIAVKGDRLFEAFKEEFKKRRVRKVYRALVLGRIKGGGKITKPIDGKEAVTIFKPIKAYRFTTLLEVEIETGRKHQIRKHMADVGHPIVGEFLYYRRSWPEALLCAPRIMLHSYIISFNHPQTGETVNVKAPLPEDFEKFLSLQED